ncbi:MAG: response regulator [Patescibacteria group bacterium]|jgi:CheY-like chemotaxis protein
MEERKKVEILLIDSDAISLIFYGEILKKYFETAKLEYKVHFAHNLDEVARKLITVTLKEIDIIVTHDALPETTGKGVCEIAKRVNPKVKVFVTSSRMLRGDEYDFREDGFDGFMLKPIDKNQFLRTILS